MYGHVTKIAAGYSLHVTSQVRPVGGVSLVFKDMRAVRNYCRTTDVKPWNF